jgi:hypothetical protein
LSHPNWHKKRRALQDLVGLGLKVNLPHLKPTISFGVNGPSSAVIVTGTIGSINNQDILKSLKGKNVDLLDGSVQIASASLDENGTFSFAKLSLSAGAHSFSIALEPLGIVEAMQSDAKPVVLP